MRSLAPATRVAAFTQETGDGDGRDFQGEDQNGTVNGATFGIGKVGQAFQFDGVNDNVEIPERMNGCYAPASARPIRIS